MKPPWSLAAAVVLPLLAMAGFIVLLGAQIQSQTAGLIEALPGSVDAAGERLGVSDLRNRLESLAQNANGGGMMQRMAGVTFGVLDAATSLIVVLIAGLYLALQPRQYKQGAIRLLPATARPEAGRAADNAGRALKNWLLGQLATMVLIGLLTTIGLMIIGVPSPMALGFLAGLSEFVPVIGPIAAAVPAVLLALSEGTSTALWTLAFYIALQQLEGNVILPLIQRRAARLPPVIMLFSILAFGMLFGPLGVILATPLAVVGLVLVQQLYVRDALGDDVTVAGENEREKN